MNRHRPFAFRHALLATAASCVLVSCSLALEFDGVGVEAALEVPASGGEVFGADEVLVLRVPTPGQLTITVDAASVAGPL